MAFFLVILDPILEPTAEPTSPPINEATSDSVSDSVTPFPATPPINAPAIAPASLSPSMVTSVISLIVPRTTYCCFWASDLETTSGVYWLFTHPKQKTVLYAPSFYPSSLEQLLPFLQNITYETNLI